MDESPKKAPRRPHPYARRTAGPEYREIQFGAKSFVIVASITLAFLIWLS